MSELRDQVDSLKDDVQTLRSENAELRGQLDRCAAASSGFQSRVETAEKRVCDMEEKVKSLTVERQPANSLTVERQPANSLVVERQSADSLTGFGRSAEPSNASIDRLSDASAPASLPMPRTRRQHMSSEVVIFTTKTTSNPPFGASNDTSKPSHRHTTRAHPSTENDNNPLHKQSSRTAPRDEFRSRTLTGTAETPIEISDDTSCDTSSEGEGEIFLRTGAKRRKSQPLPKAKRPKTAPRRTVPPNPFPIRRINRLERVEERTGRTIDIVSNIPTGLDPPERTTRINLWAFKHGKRVAMEWSEAPDGLLNAVGIVLEFTKDRIPDVMLRQSDSCLRCFSDNKQSRNSLREDELVACERCTNARMPCLRRLTLSSVIDVVPLSAQLRGRLPPSDMGYWIRPGTGRGGKAITVIFKTVLI